MPAVVSGSSAWTPSPAGSAVAIGNFDGVHLGHREVLARLGAHAARLGAPSVVYTFDPAPTAVVAPSRHQPRILTLPDRIRYLGAAGVDVVVVEPFTRAYAGHPARWFAEEVLGRRLGARVVVVGYDFRFGMDRRGDAQFLRATVPAMEVDEVGAVALGGEAASSSRIRKLVAAGDVVGAATLLGRPHRLRGTVVEGDQRGRTIGFPTANLDNEVELLPGDGVYAVLASVDGGPPAPGVMNIGMRPTFAGAVRRIEVHLLDGAGDLYGHELAVDLVARLRGEVRFDGVEALVDQIRRDITAARAVLR